MLNGAVVKCTILTRGLVEGILQRLFKTFAGLSGASNKIDMRALLAKGLRL